MVQPVPDSVLAQVSVSYIGCGALGFPIPNSDPPPPPASSFVDFTLYFVLLSHPNGIRSSILLVLKIMILYETLQVTKTKGTASSTATTSTGALAFDYTRHDSLEAEIELRKSEPLPFSSKRSMFSTGKVAQVRVYVYDIVFVCTIA